MNHRDLCESLANNRGTIFIEVPLGSVFLGNPSKADVVDIKPSYTRFCVSIYEVKVSRADFLNEIRSGKWKAYLPFCHRFYFAVKKGVCEKSEIPQEAGLITIGDNGWKFNKSVRPRDIEYNAAFFESLLSLLFYRQKIEKRFNHRTTLAQYHSDSWGSSELKKLGKKINFALREHNQKHQWDYLTKPQEIISVK